MRLSLASSALVALALVTVSPAAYADIAPMCSDYDSHTNCASADLGKACASGGTCVSITCGGAMMLTKCEVCPTVTPDMAGVCSDFSTMGKTCGDGGTCMVLAPWCANGNKLACAIAAGSAGAGGSGGSTGGTAGAATAGAAGSGTAGAATTGGSAGAAGSANGICVEGKNPDGSCASGPSSSSGGCAVGPVGKRGAAAAVMTLLGLLGLVAGRRRTRS